MTGAVIPFEKKVENRQILWEFQFFVVKIERAETAAIQRGGGVDMFLIFSEASTARDQRERILASAQ